MITYENSGPNLVRVKLEGKIVGNILPYPGGGFQYAPLGSRNTAGDVFKTIAEVKQSIEGD